MKNYYYNPKTRELVCHDTERNEVVALEQVGPMPPEESESVSTFAGRKERKAKHSHSRRKTGNAKSKQQRKYVKGKGYKKGVCGRCGKEGHSAWHCPDRKPKQRRKDGAGPGRRIKVKKAGGVRKCSKCGQPGHQARTCPNQKDSMTPDEIRERVHELQAEGQTSVAIAEKLNLSLREVNHYWDPAIAAENSKGDDDGNGDE